MKRYLLFDFFGVICSEIYPIFFKRYFDEEEAMEIKEEIMSKGDLGLLSEEEIYSLIGNKMNMSKDEVRDEFQSLIKINLDVVNFIKEKKDKYIIYLLSNAIDTFLRRILDGNNLYELFDDVFISSEISLIKPNLEFFNYVLKEKNIDPKDAIFIDDNIRNVEAARKCKIDAIHFKDIKDLKMID